jgi:hypothetical protein
MAAEFVYDFDAVRHRISNEQILAGLKAYASKVGGRAFTAEEFHRWKERPFAARLVIHRFGAWRKALAMIGVRARRPHRYDTEELVAAIESTWQTLGRRPTAAQIRKHKGISENVFYNRWGSVTNACRQVARFHAGQITREELLSPTPRERRAALKQGIRWQVLKRDGYTCQACGAKAPKVKLEVDHIVAVAQGGGDELENLHALCVACNRGKSDS